jgi:phospholipase C
MKRVPLLLIACTLAASGFTGPCEPAPDCRFAAGALPAETLPPGGRHGSQIPIDHIVVLMQENRSFDHYFDRLFREGAPPERRLAPLPPNPDPTGGPPIHPFPKTALCDVADVSHSWNASHAQWNDGENDGFTTTNAVAQDPSGSRALGTYGSADLPYYYALYATFAMSDRHFSSLLGPTYPNRLFLFAGTSFGHVHNDFPATNDQYGPSIFDRLTDAGISWKVYFSDLPFTSLLAKVRTVRPTRSVSIDDFYADAAAGTLPQVAFVEPRYFGGPNEESDEHPPANPQAGQAFVADVVRALFESPLWPHTAMFLTYDEHGGYYDHVPPPRACVPGDQPPILQPGDVAADFDRYGFRVPFVVVSPYARPRFLSHRVQDHTSILRFIETRFDLPALTARDANADPLLDLFDFESPAFLTPPTLPEATLDPEQAAACVGAPFAESADDEGIF